MNAVRSDNDDNRFMTIERCFVFDRFDEKNCDALRRLAGGENSLRPLKFL